MLQASGPEPIAGISQPLLPLFPPLYKRIYLFDQSHVQSVRRPEVRSCQQLPQWVIKTTEGLFLPALHVHLALVQGSAGSWPAALLPLGCYWLLCQGRATTLVLKCICHVGFKIFLASTGHLAMFMNSEHVRPRVLRGGAEIWRLLHMTTLWKFLTRFSHIYICIVNSLNWI